MYEEIKRLAVDAVKLQNKLNMEATLNRIAELCDQPCKGSCDESPISAGDVLVAADGQEFKVEAVVGPRATTIAAEATEDIKTGAMVVQAGSGKVKNAKEASDAADAPNKPRARGAK